MFMNVDDQRTFSRSPSLGVYISVPFCRAKCSFCNFASGVSSPAAIDSYIAAICGEISAVRNHAITLNAHLPRSVDTIYLGGGTPSLLEPVQLRRIFAELDRAFDIASDAEITLEAAPGQISDAVLGEVQRLGVNRISLGVQSFVDREAAAVGRSHTGRSCLQEIVRLQAEGFCNIGIDLIAGLPHQTAESWRQSLDMAAGIGLTHISVYMLEIDDDSRLGREVIAGGARFHADGVPAGDVSAELYEAACDYLPRHGLPQYEISNFAEVQHQSRHNRKYWQRAPYIGFGLDAHSMLERKDDAVRFANPYSLTNYSGTSGLSDCTRVGSREAFEETIFLGLRLQEGIDVSHLRTSFPHEFTANAESAVNVLVADGLMTKHDGRWRLTPRGRLISNDVFTNVLMAVAA
jgi:oxygen-independent coproporphyrinogen-3 oxidase